MQGDIVPILLIAFIIAMGLTLQNLVDESKPQYRPGCRECGVDKNAALIAEKRRQQELAREWDETRRRLTAPGAEEKVEDKKEPPKSDDWMV